MDVRVGGRGGARENRGGLESGFVGGDGEGRVKEGEGREDGLGEWG